MKVYLDNSASTPCDKRVFEKMLPYFIDEYGNADSQHNFGRQTQKAVIEARQTIATLLNCQPNEVYFTASGTESDNWALKGAAWARKERGNHIIVSSIEHHAVLSSADFLKKEGFEVSYLPVDKSGVVIVSELEKMMTDKTTLVSVMYVNNETGVIQPIKEIAQIAHKHGALFHTDCVQAAPYMKLDVKDLDCDLLTFSAHKIYGPKGVGVLYIKNGVRVERLLSGGGQERSRRGGTTNTAAVVGCAEALKIVVAEMEQSNAYIKKLRDTFEKRVLDEIPFVRLNGTAKRVPSVANFSFEFIEAEGILMLLDFAGIAVSSGSACSSGSLAPSHVLLAMGVPIEISHGSLRFSFGKHNTEKEVDYTVEKLKECVAKLREMSPLFNLKEGEIHNV